MKDEIKKILKNGKLIYMRPSNIKSIITMYHYDSKYYAIVEEWIQYSSNHFYKWNLNIVGIGNTPEEAITDGKQKFEKEYKNLLPNPFI